MSLGNCTTTGTLTSPSLHTPTIPLDLIPEILCRLPVKLLLQLKCVCKSWKSLISDPKFARKHLHVSKTYHHHHHLMITDSNSLPWDSLIPSFFSDASSTPTVPQLPLIYPDILYFDYRFSRSLSSCDGILLFIIDHYSALLWNPSIRKFKILPRNRGLTTHYTFGYDHFIDSYKVFAVTFRTCNDEVSIEVSVYTLGADSWRRIDDFPRIHDFPYGSIRGLGMFVSGSVNWLALDALLSYSLVIVSLDLKKESYRALLMPDVKKDLSTLGVLRDCLCIIANNVEFLDVWVMKEYGIEESWTKLFSVPYVGGPHDSLYTKVVYVFEDDQVLLNFTHPILDSKFIVYNSRNGTLKIPRIQNINGWVVPEVYVESLISPWS